MEEETFFEFDLEETAGVSLTVETGKVHGSTRIAIVVDDHGLAAYLGPNDVRKLYEFLSKRLRGVG